MQWRDAAFYVLPFQDLHIIHQCSWNQIQHENVKLGFNPPFPLVHCVTKAQMVQTCYQSFLSSKPPQYASAWLKTSQTSSLSFPTSSSFYWYVRCPCARHLGPFILTIPLSNLSLYSTCYNLFPQPPVLLTTDPMYLNYLTYFNPTPCNLSDNTFVCLTLCLVSAILQPHYSFLHLLHWRSQCHLQTS